jgi:hypothetical protein
MKTTNALLKTLALLLTIGAFAFSTGASAQNLITNPGFENGTTGWSTDCSMEINPEPVYGGTTSSNAVTEIDAERCFNQQVTVSAGAIYDFSFLASRRTGGGTPASVGVNVTITGIPSGTQYLNTNRTYNNTAWGYTNESFSFVVPANSTDTKVNIKFSNYSTVGTYGTLIDNVNFSMNKQSIILPIKLIGFTGEIRNNKAILNWTASNDDQDGKYFIIERAIANGNFDSIGIVAVNGISYSFTDAKMPNGVNNYRLKVVSLASSVYSKIIALDNTAASGFLVYPNPATSSIGFKMNSAISTSVNVVVCSISGSIVSMKQVHLNAGFNVATIDITSLHPGSFFLKISDEKGMNYVQGFCKK